MAINVTGTIFYFGRITTIGLVETASGSVNNILAKLFILERVMLKRGNGDNRHPIVFDSLQGIQVFDMVHRESKYQRSLKTYIYNNHPVVEHTISIQCISQDNGRNNYNRANDDASDAESICHGLLRL